MKTKDLRLRTAALESTRNVSWHAVVAFIDLKLVKIVKLCQRIC